MIIAAPAPSSRLHAPVAALVEELFPELAHEYPRTLWHRSTDHALIRCRGFDVPQLVASGAADLGIAGYDVCVEWSLAHGQPLFMWALPPVRTSFVTFCTVVGRAVSTVWTEYPAITRAWTVNSPTLRTARVVPLHGSTEGVIRADPTGGGVLLVTSGETLRANGLDHDVPLLATDVCVVARTPHPAALGPLAVSSLPELGMPSFCAVPAATA
ncbi:hypothetical protein [Micromonospora sp. WMMD714]|uniref:hypothetical protein n=1 Tax=Micromonospora sp. WMMD714 TaxID=3016097 RepID=UPI00249B59E0|nr:hypothetical protein [Micromonospora sp. WMMD714]WFE65531.1 hypothetical protein O7625_20540 [Micromonospora sp. WMMD714]